jgi:hypothetical protein
MEAHAWAYAGIALGGGEPSDAQGDGWTRQRVPGTGRECSGEGLLRPGLSESISRLPPSVALARTSSVIPPQTAPHKRHVPHAAPEGAAGVTSLVRALALHGVASRMRSHLASPLKPGRGVLIRSVSRRLGSVACVREDASPNEVPVLTALTMPVLIPNCQTRLRPRSSRPETQLRSGPGINGDDS